MATERKFAGKKLPLTIAFTVLLVAAFGAGCKGFFQPPTLTSITINPIGPTVQVGSDVSLTAFGVNSEGTGATLTSGVSWSSSDPTIAQITGSCATEPCGGVSVLGVAAGQATITAGDESVTNTATLNVILPGVTNFEVCEGDFGSTTCSNGTTPLTWTVSSQNGGNQPFVSQGEANGTEFDLTTQSTWTLTQTPAAGSISCTNDGTSPETCIVANGTTTGTYAVTITYGTTPVLTATLDIKIQ
ncbi:MAG: Ig-like domain-containing protein [Terriglobales bacterium]|jgi:hypothetical protein